MADLIDQIAVAGRLTTDIHIAALALEHHGTVHSNDREFDRFAGLSRHNPLFQKNNGVKKPGR
jgi:predicted nucleic acid-binding protein